MSSFGAKVKKKKNNNRKKVAKTWRLNLRLDGDLGNFIRGYAKESGRSITEIVQDRFYDIREAVDPDFRRPGGSE